MVSLRTTHCFILVLLLTRTLQGLPSKCFFLPSSKTTRCLQDVVKKSLKRQYLPDTTVECNDGTSAGYYLRRNKHSDLWIIYLEGGWFCYDDETCLTRMTQSNKMYSMTSSKLWSEWRHGDGLLSYDRRKNPLFWNANHVYIPYCSSDFWLGNEKRTMKTGGTISFHGAKIIASVVSHLLDNKIKQDDTILVVGSSAGGIGVLQNIDHISGLIQQSNKRVYVRGIIDSAWFLDSTVNDANCNSANSFECHPQLLFKLALNYWKGNVHTGCASTMPDARYKCLFAENTMGLLKTPIFVFQWLYDSAQILADNKDLELHPEKMLHLKYRTYIRNLGKKMQTLLRNTSTKHGVFSPSCLSHSALATTAIFDDVIMQQHSLNDAFKCWLSNGKGGKLSDTISKNMIKKNNGNKKKCSYRLIDTCAVIQCHKSCPMIQNPMTGQQIFESIIPTAAFPKIPGDLAKYDLELLNKILRDISSG